MPLKNCCWSIWRRPSPSYPSPRRGGSMPGTMPPSLSLGVVCVVAAQIAQTTADGQTHVAVVDALTVCDLVEVSEEVFDVLCQSVREMRNHERRKRYHRAFYSLDAYDWTENTACGAHGSAFP